MLYCLFCRPFAVYIARSVARSKQQLLQMCRRLRFIEHKFGVRAWGKFHAQVYAQCTSNFRTHVFQPCTHAWYLYRENESLISVGICYLQVLQHHIHCEMTTLVRPVTFGYVYSTIYVNVRMNMLFHITLSIACHIQFVHTLHCLPSKWTEWKAVHATCICPARCIVATCHSQQKRAITR